MSSIFQAITLMLLALLGLSISAPPPPVSYLDDIQLSYEDDIWQCDMITCPEGVYGCQILRKNNPEKHDELLRTNICYQQDGTEVLTTTTTEQMVRERDIDIHVWAFEGSESIYVNGYGMGTQDFNGTVWADYWPIVQQEAREMMYKIEGISDDLEKLN